MALGIGRLLLLRGALLAALVVHSGCGRLGYGALAGDADGGGPLGDGGDADGAAFRDGGGGGDAAPGAPRLLAAAFTAYDRLELRFDRAVGPTASEPVRYAISPVRPAGLFVTDAAVSADSSTVVLRLSANQLPLVYTITADVVGADGMSAGLLNATVAGERSRLAFQTSEVGPGDLEGWATARPGVTGAAAGDAICADLAASRGFVGTFVAALSDAAGGAGCRLAGLTGAYPACLGGAGTGAGPWVNTVGGLVTRSYASGLAEDFYAAVAYTETGGPVMARNAWTGTYSSGSYSVGTSCADWTSAAAPDRGIIGHATHAVSPFGSYTFSGCSGEHSLVCLQSDAGGFVDVPHTAPAGRLAFATSTTGPGDTAAWAGATRGGAAGADDICNAHAAAAGLAGRYVAWVSDATDDAYCRVLGTGGRLPGCSGGIELTGPWVTTRGVVISPTTAGLRTTPLNHPVHTDEAGNALQGAEVYTGTLASGATSGEDCGSWSAIDLVQGTVGETRTVAHRGWTELAARDCTTLGRFYCFQND